MKMETPRDRIIRAYPTIADVGNALKAEKRTMLLDRKTALFTERWPTVWELNDIYGDGGLRQRFAENCVSLAFYMKESTKPNDEVRRVHGDNFLLACRNVEVSTVVCFFAEYQAKDTYGTKFDYPSLAKEFKSYCAEWQAAKNRLIGQLEQQRQERQSDEWRKGGVGRISMLDYMKDLRYQGIDIMRSALWPRLVVIGGVKFADGNPQLEAELRRICDECPVPVSEEATKAYLAKTDTSREVAERRATLPDNLLSQQERQSKAEAAQRAYEERNKPFE